jgi:hypothetical protein
MKYPLLICLFFLSPLLSVGADSSLVAVKSIHKKAEFITTDPLGNLYIIKENFIWLYNNKGDSIGAFNSRKYGNISLVDATNPYKILVFFQDYNMLLFLDNYLSQNGEPIDLQDLGFDQVVMACQSRENGFWIFDQLKQKAFRLNANFQVTHETVNLPQWFGVSIVPESMVEYNNQLYLNDKENGIYVFDHFATYLKTIPIKNLDQIQVLPDRMNYLLDNRFCQYRFIDFESNCQKLSPSTIRSARLEKNRFYLLENDKVVIYKTN